LQHPLHSIRPRGVGYEQLTIIQRIQRLLFKRFQQTPGQESKSATNHGRRNRTIRSYLSLHPSGIKVKQHPSLSIP
jgi:hypothetical protein